MSWSGRRRGFLFIIFSALVLGGLIWGVIYFWPAATCDDGRRNQNELGVDCGGICPTVCPFEPQSLLVGWARVFRLSSGWYDAAGLIINPNPGFGVTRVPFRFRLIDADNLLISFETGEALLGPGESTAVFVSRASVGQRVPVRATLELTGAPEWYRSGGVGVRRNLVVSRRDFSPGPPPLLRATLENTGLEDLLDVRATAILSDADGNAFAASATVVPRLDAGASREISFTWPGSLPPPAVIDIYPSAPI